MLLQWSLVLICGFFIALIFVKYRRKSYESLSVKCDPEQKAVFDKLQLRFLCGFASASFADWLYGPYIYKLYMHYGYDSKMINILYVVGFFSSMIFGTLIGYLADTYGRRRLCLSYTIFGILSSLCKLSTSFDILLLGHVFTGINSSILLSVFNVWYMHEHLERFRFPREWLNSTFTTATFLNGVMAIMAGAVADIGVQMAVDNPLAPFILMIPVFIISASYVLEWDENKGLEQVKPMSCISSPTLCFLLKDIKILLMGAVQSLIEASIFAFVVVWPPLLMDLSVPQGVIFAMLMGSLSLGAVTLHTFFKNNVGSKTLLISLHIATIAFLLLTVLQLFSSKPSPLLSLIPALMLEFAAGIYFPSFGSLLSVVVPGAVRASISNLYRLPMNLLMSGILLWSHHTGHQELFSLFSVCTTLAAVASIAAHFLLRAVNDTQLTHKNGDIIDSDRVVLIDSA